ncbi:MAG: MFS transporter [Clostridia bacterium]|nr:MFS transporter [Clostridia bacterium]
MKFTYTHTTYACYLCYIAGAVINNFAPLLFVVFSNQFGISLNQLSYVIIMNFAVQMVVDFISAKYVDKIGYRRMIVIALFMAFLGLVSLGTLPFIMPAYAGILTSVFFYAVGSGMLEVMVSPTIEALPNTGVKEKAMSLLHSFYCWGCVLCICASTLYFKMFGVNNWRYLCYLWSVIPFATIFLFLKVPIIPFAGGEGKVPFAKLFKMKIFWVFALLMMCSGASELAMAQWASLFAETGLGVSKTLGDLLGPCFFAILMGIARALYGKCGDRLNLVSALIVSGLVSICGYLMSSLCQNPIISLVGCGICGFGVAIMWPGVLSLAAKHCAFGGTAIFGLLAMSGDIGCWVGPLTVARVSSNLSIMGSELKAGLLFSIIFPVLMIIGVMILKRMVTKKQN